MSVPSGGDTGAGQRYRLHAAPADPQLGVAWDNGVDPTDEMEARATRRQCTTVVPDLDLAGLPDQLGFQLQFASMAMFRDFAGLLGDLGLTQKQYSTLEIVAANPGVSQVHVAATLGTDRATMMTIIDRLEQRDLLRRVRSSDDRRRQELHAGPEGHRLLERAATLVREHERNFTSRFTPAELAVLMGALRRIQSAG